MKGGLSERGSRRRGGRGESPAQEPPLRLVRPIEADEPASLPQGPTPPVGEPIDEPHDPRWVLAVRTAEQLEGSLIPPENRERLVRLGRTLGLSTFDSNLVIAIVQDQARRGHDAPLCAEAGVGQLRMVPRPRGTGVRNLPLMAASVILLTLLVVEVLVLRWLF